MRNTTILFSVLLSGALFGLAACSQEPTNSNTAVIEVVKAEGNSNKTNVNLPSGATVEYSVDVPADRANANASASTSDNVTTDAGFQGDADASTQASQTPIDTPMANQIDSAAALAELKTSPEAVMSAISSTEVIDKDTLNTMTCEVTRVSPAENGSHSVDIQLEPRPDSPLAGYTGGEMCRIEIAADGTITSFQLAGDTPIFL